MEAVAAFGLAINVFTFVEFAAKLLKGVKEVYSTGSLPELDRFQNDTVELQRFIKQLTDPTGLAAAGAVKDLDRLAKECAALATQMIDIIGKIYTSGHKSSWRNKALMPWKAWRKQGELDFIQSRINSHRSSILEQLAFIIQKNHDDNTEQIRNQLDSMQRDLITALDKSKTNTAQGHSDIIHILLDVKSKLESLVSVDSSAKRANKILDMLWFSDMLVREASVNDPASGSYSWILQTPEEIQDNGGITDDELTDDELAIAQESAKRKSTRGRFNLWLKSGQGIFYISGKPGSGKSTLMKFLSQHTHTRQQLETWAEASSRQLVLVSFFFWISGSELQRSVVGLYRAILWEILKQCPDLMPTVFPSRWEKIDHDENGRISHLPLSLAEVQQAFERLQKAMEAKHSLCLFIDGLDEYDGDHWKLGHDLTSWRSEHVKICVSARPYNSFQQTLPLDASRHFQLHELNRGDIQDYVRGELCNDERFCRLQDQDHSSAELIMQTLVKKAEGVFVWTVFAIKSLLGGITSQHSAHQLLSFLMNRIPDGLDALFLQLLERIPYSERKPAAVSLLTMSDPSLGQYCFNLVFHWYIEQIIPGLDHYSPHQDDTSRPNLQQSSQSQMDTAKARLNSRCAGFINWIGESYEFQITHRTLGDFLQYPDTRARLHALASDVDLDVLLGRACLNIIRDFSGRQRDLHTDWPQFWQTARVLFSIAGRSEGGSEVIDDMIISIFNLQRTAPNIGIRTGLPHAYSVNFFFEFGFNTTHTSTLGLNYSAVKYDVGLVLLLCEKIHQGDWNVIARTRQQLIRLIPEASKPGILLATAIPAINPKWRGRAEKGRADAFDFVEFLLKTGVSPNLKVSGREYYNLYSPRTGNIDRKITFYGYTVDFQYTERTEPGKKGIMSPSPSSWELFLQAASPLLLCEPNATSEVTFKMIELFLAHGANPEMWFIVSQTKVYGKRKLVELPAKLHCVSLQQLVEVRKPPNSDIIRRYLSKNKGRLIWPFTYLGSTRPNSSIHYLTNDELYGPLASLVVMNASCLANLHQEAAFICRNDIGHLSLLKESSGSSSGFIDEWELRFGDA
ncbi:hypothetical protein PGQ11_001361 [Apiospora arundinis]|uniref:Nephrocystin 3-like N-terminal domain-containing protein n=1 Tax=Apiospora arundinis TaxID=335852 RepID=A0ABR2JNV5_9PEZI